MSQVIPSRHPAGPKPVPGMVRAFALALGIRKPTAAEFRRMGECLTVGDEPMDRLVEWMYSAGMKNARPLFEQALAGGIESLMSPPEPLREFFAHAEATPDWVDPDTLIRGAQVLRLGGSDGMSLGRDISLLGGYQFAGFNQTLLRTGALEKGSNTRFAETMRWAMDIVTDGGLGPFGVGYRSTLRVRMIHAMVRRHVAALPDWRADAWGLPINQTDMAATMVGSLIAPAAGGFGIGLLVTKSDLEAVAHVARYTGWLMGVRDEFLPKSFRDGVRILYHTLTALATPDETTRQLAAPMVDDPLGWNYDRLPRLRRRVARSAHLSITGAFLGPRTLRTLGVPYVLPWYPALRFPVNLARSIAAHTGPEAMARAAARGERENEAFLRVMTSGPATIGGAAEHLARTA
ncbi:oxygenase MpaB family protein [Nocardia stercoris]|uniref:DUF2236 domain-containing protein n=1 Tax=Nocardia stercoris TaxID=2483361 RepID=A0A3M2L4B8_9NOCA|nr:oxygenase MpaB family protein [Nocardia stercoris]RMI31353.1 DUF2236 domain-containing protein [Nocardia stercoris]